MISRSKSKIALPVIAIILCGCATISQFAPSQASKTYSPRTPAEKIELFRAQSPSKKFDEIGSVNACCSDDTNQLIEELRKKASEQGGDALINLDVQVTGGATASVIRYTEQK